MDAVAVHAGKGDTSAVLTVVVIVIESEDTAGIIIIIMTSGTETVIIIAAAKGTARDHRPDQVPGTTIAKGDGPLHGLGVAMAARMRVL
jgi:hypothetical protein